MCFVLYAGTAKPLARKEWRKDAPDLSIESLTDRNAPVKGRFSNPEIQYIGSTSGCGCDFPHVILQNGEWPTYDLDLDADANKLASDRLNRSALVNLLRKSGEKTIELYGLWDGDFVDTPKVRENISLKRILDSDFYFKEQGFYVVEIENDTRVVPSTVV
jgi:hypothetical protein